MQDPSPITPAEPGSENAPAPVFTHLRNLVFQTPPEAFGLARSVEYPLAWGALMELGYPQTVATLISFADGTTSLVFSSGGGMVGGGQHTAVAEASRSFVESAEINLERMNRTDTNPLPEPGRARFYLLTYEGVFTSDASVIELEREDHPLTPLYFSGQAVIAELRRIQGQKS